MPCSAVKFPDVAGSVIQLLMDFLGDTNTASALDVVFFVREIMETNSRLRPTILARLLDSFTQIRSSRVCTCSLWIIGEYSHSHPNIISATEVNPPPPPAFCTTSMLYRSYMLLSALHDQYSSNFWWAPVVPKNAWNPILLFQCLASQEQVRYTSCVEL